MHTNNGLSHNGLNRSSKFNSHLGFGRELGSLFSKTEELLSNMKKTTNLETKKEILKEFVQHIDSKCTDGQYGKLERDLISALKIFGGTKTQFGEVLSKVFTKNIESVIKEACYELRQIPITTTDAEGKKTITAYAQGETTTGTGIFDQNDRFSGEGSITYTDGKVYTGTYVDGWLNGEGSITYPDGRLEEGTFKNASLHGKGSITYADGMVETGTFRHGEKHGEVSIKHKDGSVTTGTFKDGKKDGKFSTTYPDGTVKKSHFQNGRETETRTYFGQVLTGLFNGGGRMYGEGSITYPDGRLEEGTFKLCRDDKTGFDESLLHGEGSITYKDGSVETGNFKYGKKDGKFTTTYEDGRVETNIFENGYHLSDEVLKAREYRDSFSNKGISKKKTGIRQPKQEISTGKEWNGTSRQFWGH